MHTLHLLVGTLLATDTPVDLTTQAATISTVMGGVGAGLGAVIAGALAIRGVRWGIPKIIAFFTRLS
jgi:hypothetical protein